MERRIEVKRQGAESLSPEYLRQILSGINGLRDPASLVDYVGGPDVQSGVFIITTEKDYDFQYALHIISSAGYTIIPDASKEKVTKSRRNEIRNILGSAREGLRQLRTKIGLDDILGKLKGGSR